MKPDSTDRLLDDAEDLLERLGARGRRSETSFLQGLLGGLDDRLSAVGLSPAELFSAVRYGRPLMPGTGQVLDLLAMPFQRPRDSLRPGDWIVRAVPGTGDLGHVAVLASDDLLRPSELASQSIDAEGTQPGYYGLVIEAGAFPHSRARPFARRVLDRRGRVLSNTVVLRPRQFEVAPTTEPPPDEPEINGGGRTIDVDDADEISECPVAEADVEVTEQLVPQPAAPAIAAGPDSAVANRFVAAHSSRFCAPGQAGSATCRGLASPRPIRRVVIHALAVPSTARRSGVEAVVAGWQNAGRTASSHYLVDRDGTITQMVREANVAFHTPGNNGDSIGIEHADVCNDPAPFTTQLYERSAELVRDLATRHDFPINNNSVAGHSQVNPNHGDPGPYWDWEYYRLLLSWDGLSRNSRPIRIVTAAANASATPADWQLQRRRVIANDHCASQGDPWGASYWRAQPGAGGPAAELSLVVDEPCTYKLSLWWPRVAGTNPAAPVDIEVACLTSPCSGTSTQSVSVNQRANGGRWNDVAAVNVTQTPAEVKVRWRRNSAERGWILVDGVRLLKIATCA